MRGEANYGSGTGSGLLSKYRRITASAVGGDSGEGER
jgi:hypothetical protein